MSDLAELYKNRVPKALTLAVIVLALIAAGVFGIAAFSLYYGKPLSLFSVSDKLGQQGDFFGGHLAAVAAILTLSIVIYTSFTQSQQQQRFFMREYFLRGVELMADAVHQGGELRALRVADYFARLAESEKDDELFLILNTAFVGHLRTVLEQREAHTVNNYPFAVAALDDIGKIQKRKALARKSVAQPRAAAKPA